MRDLEQILAEEKQLAMDLQKLRNENTLLVCHLSSH